MPAFDSPSSTATVNPPDSASASALVAYAAQFVGVVPYVSGGNTPAGWDCSGFVQYVFAQMGISLPHSSGAQAAVGTAVPSLAEAQPGETVLLAPAAASFDQYPNFEKRGEHFTALVKALTP